MKQFLEFAGDNAPMFFMAVGIIAWLSFGACSELSSRHCIQTCASSCGTPECIRACHSSCH